MKVKSYKDLTVWQLGMEIVEAIYTMTRQFPKDEIYGLTSQMRRAGVRIPSNIAEGFARMHTKEYIQFCAVSLGSCAELETQNIIAHRSGYNSEEDFRALEDKLDRESKMLAKLIQSLEMRL